MKRNLLLLSVLFIALFAGVSEITAQTSKKQTDNSGVLFKITGKNLKKPSYLLGTFHLICEKDLFPIETIKSYVSQTDQLMLELDLNDPTIQQKTLAGLMLSDGKTSKDYLKPEEYAKLDDLFKDFVGVSFDRFQTFKPFMDSTVITMSPKIIGCQAVPGYDKILADAAAADKKSVIGLETIEDELAAINAQPLEQQFAALYKIAADPEKSIADFKKLYALYLTQNSGELYKFMEVQMKSEPGFQENLLNKRNAKWLPTIEKNIIAAPSFIAVGDGHLGGEKGIINLLRKKGYKLTPIKV